MNHLLLVQMPVAGLETAGRGSFWSPAHGWGWCWCAVPFRDLPRFHHTRHRRSRLWLAWFWMLPVVGRWDGAGSDLATDSVSSVMGTRDGRPDSGFLSATPVPTAADPEILGMRGEGEKGVNLFCLDLSWCEHQNPSVPEKPRRLVTLQM